MCACVCSWKCRRIPSQLLVIWMPVRSWFEIRTYKREAEEEEEEGIVLSVILCEECVFSPPSREGISTVLLFELLMLGLAKASGRRQEPVNQGEREWRLLRLAKSNPCIVGWSEKEREEEGGGGGTAHYKQKERKVWQRNHSEKENRWSEVNHRVRTHMYWLSNVVNVPWKSRTLTYATKPRVFFSCAAILTGISNTFGCCKTSLLSLHQQ